MRKTGILLAAGAALLSSTMLVQARDLTVVSFGGNYQDAQRTIYFEPFAAASGQPVLEEAWEGGYGVLQAKVRAGAPNWDVVQVEADELALGCADGIFEKIDWDALGADRFIPAAVHECGAGAIVWSVAIAYDGAVLGDEGPTSWADFWDVEKFPGKRALRKTAKYALEAALMADGVPAGEVYDVLATPEGIDRAFAKLDELKPHVTWWEAGAQPLQLLSAGEVAMTSVYNGRIAGINRSEGKDFRVVWPESIYAIDSWVVLAGAENAEAGQEFIRFASQAEHQAKLPEYVAYGLPVIEAAAMVPEEFQAELPTSPANLAPALSLDVDFWIDNSEELTERFNAWIAQ